MKKTLLLFASLLLVVSGVSAESAREHLLKRAEQALGTIRKSNQVWMAKVRQVPDYGVSFDTISFDGEGDEGTFYLKLPGKYRIRWRENDDVYCNDGKTIQMWDGDSASKVAVAETGFGVLVNGTLDGANRVGAISQEEIRFEGKKQPIIFLDLEPAKDANRMNSARIYITGTGEPRVIGIRLPAERRSGYNPDSFIMWFRDLHPDKTLNDAVFKPH